MSERRVFGRGVVAGVLLMLGAQAANWLIGANPPSGSLRTYLVALQLVVGLGGAAWLMLRRLREAPQSS